MYTVVQKKMHRV